MNSYRFSIPRLIIYKQIEDGNIEFVLNIKFKDNSHKKFTYNVNGRISEARLNVFDHVKIEDIVFNFAFAQSNNWS